MFQVAANGQSVQTATGPQALLKETQPFTKLDVTKIESFQTIQILFNHEPTQPDPITGQAYTQLYQFAHGYTYIPRIWMEWQNLAPSYPAAPGPGGSATTFFTFGDDTASLDIPTFGNTTALSLFARALYNSDPTYGNASATAFLYVTVDVTNVTIFMGKVGQSFIIGGPIPPVFVIGETANIRLYVFTEPATTSTY